MKEFKRRRNKKTELLQAAGGFCGLLILGAFALFLGRGALDMYGKFASAAAARSGAEIELQELRLRHAKVGREVAALETPRGLEAELRQRYGVARPGEGEITIVRSAEASPAKEAGWGGLWSLLGL